MTDHKTATIPLSLLEAYVNLQRVCFDQVWPGEAHQSIIDAMARVEDAHQEELKGKSCPTT